MRPEEIKCPKCKKPMGYATPIDENGFADLRCENEDCEVFMSVRTKRVVYPEV